MLNHRKRLRMIQRSACARVGKRVSSSMDTPRSSLLRSASKAGHRSHRWSYISASSLQIRRVASSDLLIRFCQRRRAGWCPLRKRCCCYVWHTHLSKMTGVSGRFDNSRVASPMITEVIGTFSDFEYGKDIRTSVFDPVGTIILTCRYLVMWFRLKLLECEHSTI